MWFFLHVTKAFCTRYLSNTALTTDFFIAPLCLSFAPFTGVWRIFEVIIYFYTPLSKERENYSSPPCPQFTESTFTHTQGRTKIQWDEGRKCLFIPNAYLEMSKTGILWSLCSSAHFYWFVAAQNQHLDRLNHNASNHADTKRGIQIWNLLWKA